MEFVTKGMARCRPRVNRGLLWARLCDSLISAVRDECLPYSLFFLCCTMLVLCTRLACQSYTGTPSIQSRERVLNVENSVKKNRRRRKQQTHTHTKRHRTEKKEKNKKITTTTKTLGIDNNVSISRSKHDKTCIQYESCQRKIKQGALTAGINWGRLLPRTRCSLPVPNNQAADTLLCRRGKQMSDLDEILNETICTLYRKKQSNKQTHKPKHQELKCHVYDTAACDRALLLYCASPSSQCPSSMHITGFSNTTNEVTPKT